MGDLPIEEGPMAAMVEDTEAINQTRNNVKVRHLAIVVRNEVNNEANNKKFMPNELNFGENNFTVQNLENVYAQDDEKLLENAMKENDNENFSSNWLIFIGPASEYGLFGYEHNRQFNVNRLMNVWNDDRVKFLWIQAYPLVPDGPSGIESDGPENEPEPITTVKDLLSNKDKIKELADLQSSLSMAMCKLFPDKVNYFISTLPLSITNGDNKTFLDVFSDQLNQALNNCDSLSLFLNSCYDEFERKWKLPKELLPKFSVPSDFFLK
jgi:hypothetical protein